MWGITTNKFRACLETTNGTLSIDQKMADHIWKLQDNAEEFKIEWEIVKRANPFSPVSRKCNLCIEEKYQILFNPGQASLNSRLELFASCRHKSAKLLVK